VKDITDEELAQNDGKNGRPAYIVHKEDVIDVSDSKLWRGGVHMNRHHAGRNLTADIQSAPHGLDMLDRYPTIGRYRPEAEAAPDKPAFVLKLIKKFPMLKRHPHPMTVHFPIVFMISTTIFNLLYLLTGVKAFETTAYHCLGGGLLFTLVAILTGLYAWWMNYMSKPLRAITIKKCVSILMLILGIIAFVWRSVDPEVLDAGTGVGLLYLLIVLSFFPIVTVIGWFGAHLTFPVE